MGYRDQGGCGLDHQLRVVEDVANDFASFADMAAAWYYFETKSVDSFDVIFPILLPKSGGLSWLRLEPEPQWFLPRRF
jgi:hypothetical protein